MKVTTITYQRVLNLGDYNSCRLEKTALADEFEDQEIATQSLIESVERQIHDEHVHNQLDKEIRDRKKELTALKVEVESLKNELKRLGKIKDEPSLPPDEPDPDDIPFEAGVSAASSDGDTPNF